VLVNNLARMPDRRHGGVGAVALSTSIATTTAATPTAKIE